MPVENLWKTLRPTLKVKGLINKYTGRKGREGGWSKKEMIRREKR
jgi:hypothetical protein